MVVCSLYSKDLRIVITPDIVRRMKSFAIVGRLRNPTYLYLQLYSCSSFQPIG